MMVLLAGFNPFPAPMMVRSFEEISTAVLHVADPGKTVMVSPLFALDTHDATLD
jgi:hypothetical protein